MQLFVTAFWMTVKHSSRRLLCLVCVAGVCGLLAVAMVRALPQQAIPRAVIAVQNLDDNPISRMALQSMTQMESLSELVEVVFLSPEQSVPKEYAAYIVIPQGFLDSVLNGTNQSPIITVNADTPLEAVWVRQLAQAGASYLTSAQRIVYTVQETVDYGAQMTDRQYQLLLADVNITVMKAFLDRLALVQPKTLSASGALSLPMYYLACFTALLFCCYGFLFQPAAEQMMGFARRLNGIGRASLGFATAIHLFVLYLAALIPIAVVCWVRFGFTWAGFTAVLAFALLISGFAFLIVLLLPQRGICGAGCILLSVCMGLFSGCFVPLVLMPAFFERFAPFCITWQGQRMVSTLLGEQASAGMIAQPLVMASALYLAGALVWRFRTRRAV